MGDRVDINAESLASTLASFQAKMTQMQTLVGQIKSATTSVKSVWEGTASDAVLGQIESYQKVFEDVDAQNQKYVAFLNSVINTYKTADENDTNAVENDASSYGA
jgi:uncharacterized protein YukE